MKKTFLSLLILASALSAKAGNEGPQAAPQLPPVQTLAERSFYGGFFVPPGSLRSHSLRILKTGEVVTEKWYGDADSEITPVFKLTADQLAKLTQLVNEVQVGAMIDPNPHAPSCMDAPGSSDAVYREEVRIAIAETVNCKKMVHENATAADAQVILILDEVEKIANTPKP
jgi:hypothetical protein